MTLHNELQHLIDTKTKPIGALGQLETIARQIGIIQQTITPVVNQPHIVVFAGDHGIAATGLVNPYPQEVTAQMVLNYLNGGAAINVFCQQNNIQLKVVDAGVAYDFSEVEHSNFIKAKIAMGTRNYMETTAMSEEECIHAIEKGKEIVKDIYTGGCNCIGFGEMGISNTSSASLIMSTLLQLPVANCVGAGTGTNEEQLKLKTATLEKVAAHHQLHSLAHKPLTLLAAIGGYEIAMMTGAYLAATELGMVILIDGFIATAALLIAQQLNSVVINHSIFAHASGEQGHERMLEHLNAKPLLKLGLRLGEGTGAALAYPLVQAAVNFLNQMASFESAGVSQS